MKYKIPFIKPSFPDATSIAADYESILEANWFTNFGPFEQKFRQHIEEYLGKGTHAVTVVNATAGLMLAIEALLPKTKNVKEVIMPAFTFASGAEALISLGYKPILIDINPLTWQPDIHIAESYLAHHRKQVAGILFCNVFGVGDPEIEQWESVAQKNKLPLIIDSAAGFGSQYQNAELLGGRGECEVFSLHATKTFAIGEGGLITTRSKALSRQLKQLSNFGFNDSKKCIKIGLNAKLQELSAAIGIRQLETLSDNITQRQKKLKTYKALLEPHGYQFQANDEQSSLAFVSTLAPTQEEATKFFNRLTELDIEVRRYYSPPLHQHPAIKDQSSIPAKLTHTESICQRIISLPVHSQVSQKEIQYICSIAVQ